MAQPEEGCLCIDELAEACIVVQLQQVHAGIEQYGPEAGILINPVNPKRICPFDIPITCNVGSCFGNSIVWLS